MTSIRSKREGKTCILYVNILEKTQTPRVKKVNTVKHQ